MTDVVFYFGDAIERNSLYQLKQWLGPLGRLSAHVSVTVVCGSPEAAALVRDNSQLAFVQTDESYDGTPLWDLKPRVVLYPNQFFRNFAAWAYPNAAHVFVSHGESDKTYMSQNSLKYFDYVYVAGEVAEGRIQNHVPGFPEERCIRIGRPQMLDEVTPPPREWAPDRDRTIVLYAPTWEGGLTQNRYGSVMSHGRTMVEKILARSDEFQLIYKPHPFTGTILPSWKVEDTEIAELIAEANRANPENKHLVDRGPFGWQLTDANVMISDVSAVAYDWLSTGKPMVVTRPDETDALLYDDGILGALPLLGSADAGTIAGLLRDAVSDPESEKFFREWGSRYFASVLDDNGVERFIAETARLVADMPTIKSVTTESQPSANPRASIKGSTRRALLPLAVRQAARNAIIDSKWPRLKKQRLLLADFDTRPISVEYYRQLDRVLPRSIRVELIVLSAGNWTRGAWLTLTQPWFRARFSVRFAPPPQETAVAIRRRTTTTVYYARHCAANHFGVRLNELRHVLLHPEFHRGFKPDHNLIAYDAVITTDDVCRDKVLAFSNQLHPIVIEAGDFGGTAS